GATSMYANTPKHTKSFVFLAMYNLDARLGQLTTLPAEAERSEVLLTGIVKHKGHVPQCLGHIDTLPMATPRRKHHFHIPVIQRLVREGLNGYPKGKKISQYARTARCCSSQFLAQSYGPAKRGPH